ncbi:glycosyltransferase [Bacillus cereus group sp. MYBK71-2]|uniref:glycosyltransferase n=1 Tax=Bacillus cereus group sp. MYBK71-2 TaxID=3450611 RepID=UPI003F7A5F10
MNKEKVILVYRGDVATGSGEQTRLLNIVKSIDVEKKILLLIDISEEELLVSKQVLQEIEGLEVRIIKSKNNFIADYKDGLAQLKMILDEKQVNSVVLVNNFALLYAPYCKKNKLKTIWSMHGVHEEKLNGTFQSKMKVFAQKKLEAFLLKYVEVVMVVSERMANYIQKDYKYKKCICIVPCAVDDKIFHYSESTRDLIRSELGISNKFVLTYLGLYQKWQSLDELVDIYMNFKKIHNQMHMLIISPNVMEFENLMRNNNISPEEYTILSLNHAEVAKYLMASDLGYIIRKKDVINENAFPTKFAEYLICGCPVIVNKGVGSYGDYVERYKLGLPIDIRSIDSLEDNLDQFLKGYLVNGTEMKKHCNEFARDNLSWDNFSKLITKII